MEEGRDGNLYTYSGLTELISDEFNDYDVVNQTVYPETECIVWDKKPFDLYPYQKKALEAFITETHANIEMGTGLGKSLIALYLVKHFSLKTIVISPSKSISKQLYKLFCKHFGKKHVGFLGDGKKEFNKKIIIAIDDSVVNVKIDSEGFKCLQECKVMIWDESHTSGAKTLSETCFGVLNAIPYRYFLSGTQTRGDGGDLLLQSIIGKNVFTMTVREGVDSNYLAKPIFKMVEIESDSSFANRDINKMTRNHLYYNPKVIQKAALIANQFADNDYPVLILIDEYEQFSKLLPYLRHKCLFAHGTLTEDNKQYVPLEYQKRDPNDLIEDFNNGKSKILIGTSCIGVGSDVKAVKSMIYLRGGMSEVEVKQSVGRCTRLFPEMNKTSCYVTDFDVSNIPALHRHALERGKIYADIYAKPEYINI